MHNYSSQGRGKTTLISVLRTPSAPLPSNVSTVGVEVAEWTLSPPPHVMRGIKKGQPLQRVSTLDTVICIHVQCIICTCMLGMGLSGLQLCLLYCVHVHVHVL